MKSFIVLSTIALVAFVAADGEWKPKGFVRDPESHDKCFAEAGFAKDESGNVYKKQPSDENHGHKYTLCVMKKKGLFTEESGYNVDRLVAELTTSHIEEAKARELVTKCVDNNEQKSAPAAWAARFVECMYKNNVDDLLTEAENAKNLRMRASTSNDSERR